MRTFPPSQSLEGEKGALSLEISRILVHHYIVVFIQRDARALREMKPTSVSIQVGAGRNKGVHHVILKANERNSLPN